MNVIKLSDSKASTLIADNGNSTENCSSCHYSRFQGLDAQQGACQCNPPQIIVVPQQNPLTQQVSLTVQSMYPMVDRKSWCGAYDSGIEEENPLG